MTSLHVSFRSTHRLRNSRRGAKTFTSLAFLLAALALTCLSASSAPPEKPFTSQPAKAAYSQYKQASDQAAKQFRAELREMLKATMQAGQLEEANRIGQLVEDPESNTPLTSIRGKSARAAFQKAMERATAAYERALQSAMALSLRTAQLEESNRIAAELEDLKSARATRADSASGFINLLPLIDPAKDTVAGSWSVVKGALTSSGKGEEKLQLPYEPPAEYDYRITFTKETGTNCVVQMLASGDIPFIWVMGNSGNFTFHYVKSAGLGPNKTTVQRPNGLKNGRRHTSFIKVRKDGCEAFLDSRSVSKWETDYADVSVQPWWLLRDKSLLGVGTGDSRTLFHSIEVKEVSGTGKL